MHHFSFARPIALLPASLGAKLATQATLSDDENELLNAIRGVAPGFPEAFATEQARDAALGPYGPYVTFVPASWIEIEAGGFPVPSVAIGHNLGDPDFAEVASPILDAIANETQGCDNRDVVVCRTRYIVRRQSNGPVRTCGWVTEFGGTAIENHTGLETAKYLDSELNRRLDNFDAR